MEPEGVAEPGLRLDRALIVLVLVVIVVCLPIWLVKFPPIVDYPMHVARAYLLSLPQDGHGITEFYAAKWQPIPNLGMDILVAGLCRLMPALVAGKVFLCLILASLLSGAFALSLALNRKVTLTAFLPALLVYDQWFFMGFANYLFGLGLALWFVALWLFAMDKPSLFSRVSLIVLGGALLVCHLLAFALSLAIVAGICATQRWGLTVAMRWLAGGALAFCGLGYLGLTFLHRTPIAWNGRLWSLLQIVRPIDGTFSVIVSGAAVVLLAGLILTKTITVNSTMKPVLAALAVFTIVGPSFLGGTAFACDRLTLPLSILALCSLNIKQPKKSSNKNAIQWAIAGIAFALLFACSLTSWFRSAPFDEKVTSACAQIPARSTLATVDLGLRQGRTWTYQRHVADWILLDKPMFVASNFAKARQQPMVFQPEFEPWHLYQNNNPIELTDWPSVARESWKMARLQAELNHRFVTAGRLQSELYLLVFHPEYLPVPNNLASNIEIVFAGTEFAILHIASEPPQATNGGLGSS